MRGEINEVRMRDVLDADETEKPGGKDPDDDADWVIGDTFKPSPHRPLHAVRCVAINKSDGKRCRRWSVIGFTKCPAHSGYGKLANLKEYRERVIERARLDLLRTAPYAVETIAEMVSDPELNPAVRLKASLEVLDRVGIRGGSELQIDAVVADGTPTAADEVRVRLDRLRVAAVAGALETNTAIADSELGDELESSPTSGAPSAGETEILDAELVDESEEDGGDDSDVAV
jgi:hypothetical protein